MQLEKIDALTFLIRVMLKKVKRQKSKNSKLKALIRELGGVFPEKKPKPVPKPKKEEKRPTPPVEVIAVDEAEK
jgi:hypothetical protein